MPTRQALAPAAGRSPPAGALGRGVDSLEPAIRPRDRRPRRRRAAQASGVCARGWTGTRRGPCRGDEVSSCRMGRRAIRKRQAGSARKRPVSRVLSDDESSGRSFLSECGHPHPPAADPRRLDRGGLPLAAYLALLRLGFTMPPPLPVTRWALTTTISPLPVQLALCGRSVFCGTFRHAAPRGVRAQALPGSLSMEPGLSSAHRRETDCRDHPTVYALRKCTVRRPRERAHRR